MFEGARMFRDLGIEIAEYIARRVDRYVDVDLLDVLDYEVASKAYQEQLIDYSTFKYGTGDETYDYFYEAKRTFLPMLRNLLPDGYDLVVSDGEARIVRR